MKPSTLTDRRNNAMGRAFAIKSVALKLGFALAIGGFCSVLLAQQVYRIVGPDGRVTFSDQPPPSASNAKVTSGVGARSGVDTAAAALPFELREPATKYPVTLYSGNNCNPCNAGKALLASRGIPFAEKTVTTQDDAEALQRLSSDASLPLLTIGGQQIKGYSDVEWNQFLDAAGYPKTSILPAGFRNAPASPLVAAKKADASAATAAAATSGTGDAPAAGNRRPAAPRPATPPENTNPAGIRF